MCLYKYSIYIIVDVYLQNYRFAQVRVGATTCTNDFFKNLYTYNRALQTMTI